MSTLKPQVVTRVAVTALVLAATTAAGCAPGPCDLAEATPGATTSTTCEGLDVDVSRPEAASCEADGCGLILDVHGFTMSSAQQDRSTGLSRIGPRGGFVVLQPNAPGRPPATRWEAERDDVVVRALIEAAVDAFEIDSRRVHMTGFSQGGFMSWRFGMDHADLVASIAPMAAGGGCQRHAASAPMYTTPPDPPVDVLFVAGVHDTVVEFSACQKLQMVSVLEGYGFEAPGVLSEDELHRWTWASRSDGATLEYIEHRYSLPEKTRLGGHCIPGGADLGLPKERGQLFAYSCPQPAPFVWGDEVVRFFSAHRR